MSAHLFAKSTHLRWVNDHTF